MHLLLLTQLLVLFGDSSLGFSGVVKLQIKILVYLLCLSCTSSHVSIQKNRGGGGLITSLSNTTTPLTRRILCLCSLVTRRSRKLHTCCWKISGCTQSTSRTKAEIISSPGGEGTYFSNAYIKLCIIYDGQGMGH